MSTNQSKSFKRTPIPHRTQSGKQMVYYALSHDGSEIMVSRAVCLARPNQSDSRYPQRWFVDEESGLVVRLPRNKKGEKIARENMRSIWREEKYQKRRCSCVAEGSTRCPILCVKCPLNGDCNSIHTEGNGMKCVKKCEFCNLPHASRTVELDMTFNDDSDESDIRFAPADELDMASVEEEKALLDTLKAALSTLTQEDQDLVGAIFHDGKTERQLAAGLSLKQSKSVNKRKQKILKTLRQNEVLRSFFK